MNKDETLSGTPLPLPCERTVDLGAYLVGGMSEAESRSMRLHIDTCTWCSAELHELRPIANLFDTTELASAIVGERLEPTPDAASRLFARANAELASSTYSNVVATHGIVGPSGVVAQRRPRKRTIVAAGVAVFALGVGSTLGTERLVATPKKPKRALESVRFATISLRAPSPSPPVTLPGLTSPKAWAAIDQTPSGTYAYLYVRDFEVGKVYRWWFIKRDGTRVPLGSFRYPGAVEGDEWLQCPGHTALPRTELIAIGATNEDGFDVVRQDLPAAPKIVAT